MKFFLKFDPHCLLLLRKKVGWEQKISLKYQCLKITDRPKYIDRDCAINQGASFNRC